MLIWIVETTCVAAAMAFVAFMAGRVRSIGPAGRHVLWLVVLIKLAFPPIISWPWASAWHMRGWPHRAAEGARKQADSFRIDDGWAPLAGSRFVSSLDETLAGPRGLDRSQCDMIPPPEQFIQPTTAQSIPCQRDKDGFRLVNQPMMLTRWVTAAWLVISLIVAIGQALRIVRFRRRLRAALPAPDELIDEAGTIGWRLGVTAPELLVVAKLGSPMLWCLGRPRLLLPARLVKSLSTEHWRGILTHELAHLRRGDHWVSRFEFVAGLFWWWHPLYWLARTRIDAEAELACDAWVVWASPKDRLAYASILFDVCAAISLAKPPAPVLSVGNHGRFLERRLTMILHHHVPCHLSRAGLFGASLFLLFALPSWSATPVAFASGTPVAIASDSATDLRADDDDDDKDVLNKEKEKDERAASARKSKAKKRDLKSNDDDDSGIEAGVKEIESQFGPGSGFEKRMEAFGKEMERKFGPGSDFEKKIEAFGKEIENQFGSGSDFEKKMEAFGEKFGKETEARFGPGSDFEKKMKKLGSEMKDKFTSDSDLAKDTSRKSQDKTGAGTQAKASQKPISARRGVENAKPDSAVGNRKRERRVAELEAEVQKLMAEIKALKHDSTRDE